MLPPASPRECTGAEQAPPPEEVRVAMAPVAAEPVGAGERGAWFDTWIDSEQLVGSWGEAGGVGETVVETVAAAEAQAARQAARRPAVSGARSGALSGAESGVESGAEIVAEIVARGCVALHEDELREGSAFSTHTPLLPPRP